MKKFRDGMLLLILIGTLPLLVRAQAVYSYSKTTFIQAIPLQLTQNKTVNLIFPYTIVSVDRGSADILVQKAAGAENILQAKAGKIGFEETNLTVIIAGGKLYSFIVTYVKAPAQLNISIHDAATPKEAIPSAATHALFTETKNNSPTIQTHARQVANHTKNDWLLRNRKRSIEMALNGIYIKEDIIYLKLLLQNWSNINYDIEGLRFVIRDKKKSKRTSSQEIDVIPLSVLGSTQMIKGKQAQTVVVALQKFTIPDGKYLAVELKEANGGRHLSFKANNNKIIRAKLL